MQNAPGGPKTAPRNRAPAYWIFAPAVVLSLYVLWISHVYEMQSFVTVLGLSALGPALLGIAFRMTGLRVASSICAVIVLACYWCPISLFCLALISGNLGLFYAFAPVLVLCIPGFFVAIVATLSFADRAGGSWAASALLVGIVPSVIFSAAASNQARSSHSQPATADFMVLVPDFVAINKCSHQFAASHHARGYPETLAHLGPQGTQCLPEDLVTGVRKDFTIRYQPGPRDDRDRIETYSVIALEIAPKSQYRSTLYTSESGLIWDRFDGPGGMGSPTLSGPSPGIHFDSEVMYCLWQGYRTTWRIQEGNDEEQVNDRDLYMKKCITDSSFQSARTFSLDQYIYEYKFSFREDGSVAGFQLSARPQSYGVTGLRSYLSVATLTQTGDRRTWNVYATPEDRPATPQDPLARSQEVGSMSRDFASVDYCAEFSCR